MVSTGGINITTLTPLYLNQEHTTSSAGNASHSHRVEAYLYGTVSVLVVSLLSLVGAAILPFVNKKIFYRATILTFMALAVGTMTSDAFLHLVPETLGLHEHDHDEKGGTHSPHQQDQEEEHKDEDGHHHHHDKSYILYMSLIILSIYGLYIFEVVSVLCGKYFKYLKHSHGHGEPHDHFGHGGMHANLEADQQGQGLQEMKRSAVVSPAPSDRRDVKSDSSARDSIRTTASFKTNAIPKTEEPPIHLSQQQYICGLKPVAFIVIFGDGLHNFCDGLAIGAAFVSSPKSGLATSIAVVCHEIPHEVGDFAILLNSGMSIKQALVYNFLSALTAFAGLYVGIEIGTLESTRVIIFALVAGGFLYVSLVHMLNEIKEASENLHWGLALGLQNAGFLFGFIVVLLLAYYE